MKSKTKKNPQDATLRNINALKKRVTKLEKSVKLILSHLSKLFRALDKGKE